MLSRLSSLRPGEEFFPALAANRDIQVYAALLSLSCLTRADLKGTLDCMLRCPHAHAHAAGEGAAAAGEGPALMASLINRFLHGDYASLWSSLGELRSVVVIRDMYMSSHANRIYNLIADKIVLQYFAPFKSVDLTVMAAKLLFQYEELEAILCNLISSGQLAGMIPTHTPPARPLHSHLHLHVFSRHIILIVLVCVCVCVCVTLSSCFQRALTPRRACSSGALPPPRRGCVQDHVSCRRTHAADPARLTAAGAVQARPEG